MNKQMDRVAIKLSASKKSINGVNSRYLLQTWERSYRY